VYKIITINVETTIVLYDRTLTNIKHRINYDINAILF